MLGTVIANFTKNLEELKDPNTGDFLTEEIEDRGIVEQDSRHQAFHKAIDAEFKDLAKTKEDELEFVVSTSWDGLQTK